MNRQGKIFLVGFGPGAEAHMTARARQAIAESDVVIGYSTYVKLVQDLLDGKTIIRKGMTEELDRCVEAYNFAQQGKTVALISSGDVGVYGMAGPTYEVLMNAGWTPGGSIDVEVVPGATALNSCAALVGAPLSHDFCSISLSDLLTPWPVIARRLEAAARADFVTALYNPKSGRRTQQIVQAQEIFLRHRDPKTPVAIVKSAYRERQSIQMVELSAMADCDIGMLTTVLIGNSSTFLREGLMITPRGYANKYDTLTGEVRDGERAGRSLTMGLEGWHGCVRLWLNENDASIEDTARYFDAPMGEILRAISLADNGAGDHRVKKTSSAYIASWMNAVEVLRLQFADVGGHCIVRGREVTISEQQIMIVNDYLNYVLPLNRVADIYLHRHPKNGGQAYLIDRHGRNLWRFGLEIKSPHALDRFETVWAKCP